MIWSVSGGGRRMDKGDGGSGNRGAGPGLMVRLLYYYVDSNLLGSVLLCRQSAIHEKGSSPVIHLGTGYYV